MVVAVTALAIAEVHPQSQSLSLPPAAVKQPRRRRGGAGAMLLSTKSDIQRMVEDLAEMGDGGRF